MDVWYVHANFDFNGGLICTEVELSIKKGLNGQNHSLSDSHHSMQKSPFPFLLAQGGFPPYLLMLLRKPWELPYTQLYETQRR